MDKKLVWMLTASAVYLGVALYNLFHPFVELYLIQMAWIIVLSMPFWIPIVGRWTDTKMFWKKYHE